MPKRWKGGELYITNNPDYANIYDIFVEDVPETKVLYDIIGRDSILDSPESEFINIFQEYFRTKENDAEILLERLLQDSIGKHIKIRKCEYVDANY